MLGHTVMLLKKFMSLTTLFLPNNFHLPKNFLLPNTTFLVLNNFHVLKAFMCLLWKKQVTPTSREEEVEEVELNVSDGGKEIKDMYR